MSYAVVGCAGCSGLGFDGGVGAPGSGVWTSEVSVRGLAGQAASVPEIIAAALEGKGFTSVSSDWKAGGKVWFRYAWPASGALFAEMLVDSTRRSAVRQCLLLAVQRVSQLRPASPPVVFVLTGGSTVPAAATPPPPTPADTLPGDTTTTTNPVNLDQLRTTKPTLVLQRLLIQKGFNLGSSGADGRFGPATKAQLLLALGTPAPAGGFVGVTAPPASEVTMMVREWEHIMALPDAPPGTVTTPRRPVVLPVGVTLDTTDGGANMAGGIQLMDWLPWVIGGSALLGVGAFFLFYKPKRKVAKNRRRRSSRSR